MITGEEDDTESKQEARAKLREGFMRAIIELNGKTCSILNYEKTLLEAEFAGWNVEGHEVLLKDLKTPSSTVPSALLRTPDILALQFKNQFELP